MMMDSKKSKDQQLEKLKFEVTQETGIHKNYEYKVNRKKSKSR